MPQLQRNSARFGDGGPGHKLADIKDTVVASAMPALDIGSGSITASYSNFRMSKVGSLTGCSTQVVIVNYSLLTS